MTDPYLILGLSPGVGLDAVRVAYRRLAMKHHPDRGGDVTRFQEIKAAFELIDSGRYVPVPARTDDGKISGMTLDYINMKMQHPDPNGVCSTCGGTKKVNVAVGEIGWRTLPCPKCA